MRTGPNHPRDAQPVSSRALPAYPNLELEHQRSEQLLRELKAADPAAVARAGRYCHIRNANAYTRSHARLTIAREYGFSGWPRLIEYLTALERHQRSGPLAGNRLSYYEGRAETLLAQHREARSAALQQFGAFVPRFYGMSVAQVAATSPTVDEARLAIAREERLPSWEALVEYSVDRQRSTRETENPLKDAQCSVRAGNLVYLKRIVGTMTTAQPESFRHNIQTLLVASIRHECERRTSEMRNISDWLVGQGGDLREALGKALIKFFLHTETAAVAYLIDRSADLTWMPPNGISILEHAIARYWNGEAVDLVARHVVVARQAFWIAAGLGEVEALSRYVDARGVPTAAARKERPDFTAIGPFAWPAIPDAPDEEIVFEAFYAAAINSRFEFLDALLQRGFPIDYMQGVRTQPLLHDAIGNRKTSLVEFLTSRGADLSIRGWLPAITQREMAQYCYATNPEDPERRRILALCDGGDPEAVLRAYQDRRTT